jgi:hypothetical protein
MPLEFHERLLLEDRASATCNVFLAKGDGVKSILGGSDRGASSELPARLQLSSIAASTLRLNLLRVMRNPPH